MLDNIDEGNSYALISVSVFLLIFSFTSFQSFPLFVLPSLNETDATSSSLLLLFDDPSNSTSSSTSQSPEDSVTSSIADSALVAAYLVCGFIFMAPLLVGNWKITNKFYRILRIVLGLLFSSLYLGIVYVLVKHETREELPFHKGLGYFYIVNMSVIVLSHLLLLAREFTSLSKLSFRKRMHLSLVKRLLRPPHERRANKAAGFVSKKVETSFWGKLKSVFKSKKVPHKEYERFFDMFYPQRLVYSTLCTLFVVLSIALVIAANFIQFSKYYFPLLWETFFGTKNLNTFKIEFDKSNIRLVIGYVAYASLIPWLILVIISILLFVNYRKEIFKLRQGKHTLDINDVQVFHAPKFLGRQLFTSMISFFILFGLGVIIVIIVVVSIFVPSFRESFLYFFFKFIFIILGSIILGCIFVNKGALRNRRLFFVYDYFSTMAYLITGFVDAIKRLTNALISLCFVYPRMDTPMYGGDLAYMAFMTLVYTDHQYNNPILNVFVDLAIKTITDNQKMNQFEAVEKAPLLSSSSSSIPRSRSFTLARNRWHLCVLLINNPSLVKYRKQWADYEK